MLQGFAYVPRDDLVSLVANEFRVQLSRALAVGISCFFFTSHITNIVKADLLTVQVVWSRWLDICLVIFCVFYSVTSTNKNAKKNLADIQLSWPHTWSIMILYFLQMTARALPYLEEDERLLPKLTNLRFVLLAQCNAITLSGEFCCLVCDDLLVFHYNVFNI